VDYTDVLRQAWRTTWRSRGIWAFLATSFLPFLLLGAGVIGFSAAALVPAFVDGAEPGAETALAIFGAVALAGLVSIPLGLLLHGGLIRLTCEAQEGRRASAGVGWREGGRALGRVLVFEIVLGAVAVLSFGLLSALFAGALSLADAGSGDNVLPVVAVFCLGYLLFLVLAMVAIVVLFGFESVGVRYAVIEERSGLDAFVAAVQTVRSRFKNVVAMALILVAMQWGASAVLIAFTSPLQMLVVPSLSQSGGDAAPAFPPQLYLIVALVYLLTFIAQIPMTIFFYAAWTAFFRKLTGRDDATHEELAPLTYPEAYIPPPPPPSGDASSAGSQAL